MALKPTNPKKTPITEVEFDKNSKTKMVILKIEFLILQSPMTYCKKQ